MLGLGRLLPVPALEPLDASAGVDQLLLARVERVALRAQLDVELGLRRARLERVPARAANDCLYVRGMDLGLHRFFLSVHVLHLGDLRSEEHTSELQSPMDL